jgi:hypothetical protein
MSELAIRPAMNDNQVIADLLAPGGAAIDVGRRRPIIGRLVADAHVAAKRRDLADAARGAGIPFVVDPLTHLLQGELRADDPWAKLPFGRAELVASGSFDAANDFVKGVVSFELEHEATAVVAPYAYVAGPDDPWFEVGLRWLHETRAFMDASGVAVPMIAVLCGQLLGLGAERSWPETLDRFHSEAGAAGASAIAICLSPAGNGKDSYAKVMRLFRAAQHMRDISDVPVYVWRQGFFGPGLVGAGLDGYETGIGIGEQSNLKSNIASRKPPRPGQPPGRGGSAGIYLEPLGRSIKKSAAQIVLANVSMRAKLMCSDEQCCPQGVASTLDHYREHAVRSRARELAALDALPARTWRLNQIATKAEGALSLAVQTNKLLEEVDEDFRVGTVGIDSLQRVAEELRLSEGEGRAVA